MTESRPDIAADALALRLKTQLAELPFVSSDLPGIGGTIKAAPEHFEVEEILPYQPCGEGEHLYITLRRSGWNTADVAQAIAKTLDIKFGDVGWGGRKDKQARATQTFSLLFPLERTIEEVSATLATLPFEILSLMRHRNKIKTGHVAANRFRILLTQTAAENLPQARAIAERLLNRGVPNLFGEQRFGIDHRNIDRAAELLHQPRAARGNQAVFLVSALQGALFNVWLKERISRGDFNRILLGDVAQKTDTGGIFIVDRIEEADARLQAGAIVYTGPIFGFKSMAAKERAGALEDELLRRFGLEPSMFKPLRAPGTRRQAVLRLDDLAISPAEAGLEFSFTLPSGAYATTVMREFMRPPLA
jgi:tRNA pseudouridine13 synthase